jgi:hypothetical protein
LEYEGANTAAHTLTAWYLANSIAHADRLVFGKNIDRPCRLGATSYLLGTRFARPKQMGKYAQFVAGLTELAGQVGGPTLETRCDASLDNEAGVDGDLRVGPGAQPGSGMARVEHEQLQEAGSGHDRRSWASEPEKGREHVALQSPASSVFGTEHASRALRAPDMRTPGLRGDRVWREGLLEETVFLRMRTKEGLDLGAVSDAFGAEAAASLRDAGLRLAPSGHVALSPDGSRLQIVGTAGFMFEHAIAAELISSLP